MQYLLLIYEDEAKFTNLSEEEGNRILGGYFKFTDDLKASGAYLGGEALVPVSTARTVRTRAGKTTVTDGPFAETKEQLGGYYLLDVDHLDDAIEAAARCPGAAYGTIELRPVMQLPDPPA